MKTEQTMIEIQTMVTSCAPWEPNDQDYTEQRDYLASLLSSWRNEHEHDDDDDLFEIVDGFFVNPKASRKLIDIWMEATPDEPDNTSLQSVDVCLREELGAKNSATCQSDFSQTTTKPEETKTARARSPKRERRRKKKESRSKADFYEETKSEQSLYQVVDKIHETSAIHLDALDDFSSAWEDAKAEGRVWGGRGFGGRGVNRGLGTYKGRDAVVDNLTLAFEGKELLRETHLVIAHGHRYGLWGKNGVGKSTLLRRIASGRVPGWPLHLSVKMVEQEILGSDKTVRECMATAGGSITSGRKDGLEEELADLEMRLAEHSDELESNDIEEITIRMSELYEELEDIERKEYSDSDASNSPEDDAFYGLNTSTTAILRGLSFEASMLDAPVRQLSGGWRMKVALAEALCCHPDILLLDEPTNHLDASATIFLEDYILKHDLTVVVVSHSGDFLDTICTDMIKFENQSLEYHVGNYSTFKDREEQLMKTNTKISQAVNKKEQKAMEFIQKQKSMSKSKRRDDNKQRQAKEREKKIGRIGLYNSNGKKFKLLSERKGVNIASHIHGTYTNSAGFASFHVDNSQKYMNEDRQKLRFQFPSAAPLKTATGEFAPLITLDECRFRYGSKESPWLLQDMTLGVSVGSRIGILGKNGAGKSTIVKLLSGELSPDPKQGTLWRHPGLKIAHISQHHIEHLGAHLKESPIKYFQNQHGATATSDHQIRQYLGGFGLVGDLPLQPIGSLSGGQKARLAFATVMYNPPHVLVLDEPTNHLDLQSLESLANAVSNFDGAVVVVSHHKGFLAQTCKEIWTIQNDGTVLAQTVESEANVNQQHRSNFDVLYENYKEGLRKEVRRVQKIKKRCT